MCKTMPILPLFQFCRVSSHDTALDPSHLIFRDITVARWSEKLDGPLDNHSVVREGEKDGSFMLT